MTAWLWLALAGCSPDSAEAWVGTFSLVDYRSAEVPEDTTETRTTTVAVTGEVDCDSEPTEADWGYAGFAIERVELETGSYMEILPCSASDDCEFAPWIAGGTNDLGPNGGTAKLAATSFIASSLGGGICELFWWDLIFSGSADQPSIELVSTGATFEMEGADALDCEAELDSARDHECSGRYLLDGKRW